jgi:hypothetical protein
MRRRHISGARRARARNEPSRLRLSLAVRIRRHLGFNFDPRRELAPIPHPRDIVVAPVVDDVLGAHRAEAARRKEERRT